jgi:sulfite exporter TauE/SafE
VNAWLTVLPASLLGSLHCVGMCGGLVGFYAATDNSPNASRWAPHAAYHSTRLGAYMLLGALAGGFGSLLDRFGARVGFGELGVFVTALTLLSWGLPLLLGRRAAERPLELGRGRGRARRSAVSERLGGYFAALASRMRRRPPVWRASALGLSSALLPCGWLYGFVALAVSTGSWMRGAVLLLAFWSGTVPALLGLGLGFGFGRLRATLRARLPRLSAAVVLAICASNVIGRWPVAGASTSSASFAPGAPSCHGSH